MGPAKLEPALQQPIEPVFRQLEQESFSISALPLGDIQVRDVRVTVADAVEITADFGTAA